MRRNIASCLLKARFAITTRHGPPAHVRECSRLPCPFHQTCHLTCGHAPRRKAAFWKAPRFCCSTSTRIRIDWTCLVLTLLLKHLGIPGRAKATMPGRQADPDQNQKSARQRNQTKRPGSRLHCGCHSDGTCGAGRPAMAAQSSFVEIPQQLPALFDHLVGAPQERFRYREAALAALRLMTSSNLIGVSTESSL